MAIVVFLHGLFFCLVFILSSGAFAGSTASCESTIVNQCDRTEEPFEKLLKLGRSASTNIVFRFQEKQKCLEAPTNSIETNRRNLCILSSPKSWTPSEQEHIQQVLNRLMTNPKARGILMEIASHGHISIFRTSSLFSLSASGKPQELSGALAFADGGALTFTDRYFNEAELMNKECAGLIFDSPSKELERIVLHEIIHIYASHKNKLDYDCSFLKAIGWDSDRDSVAAIEKNKLAELRAESRKLNTRDAGAFVRREAQIRGFPSLYAMINNQEAFADILAVLILDETSEKYLKPEMVSWFQKNVFESRSEAKLCPLEYR